MGEENERRGMDEGGMLPLLLLMMMMLPSFVKYKHSKRSRLNTVVKLWVNVTAAAATTTRSTGRCVYVCAHVRCQTSLPSLARLFHPPRPHLVSLRWSDAPLGKSEALAEHGGEKPHEAGHLKCIREMMSSITCISSPYMQSSAPPLFSCLQTALWRTGLRSFLWFLRLWRERCCRRKSPRCSLAGRRSRNRPMME